MILAIDMGNSNIVVGGIDDKRTYFEERITTDEWNRQVARAQELRAAFTDMQMTETEYVEKLDAL